MDEMRESVSVLKNVAQAIPKNEKVAEESGGSG
jgi:hypothetical protein